jgi:hypothetical protein
MKFSVQARQINYGYFQIEADSVSEAHKILDEMLEDEFIRDYAEWEIGEIEVANLS